MDRVDNPADLVPARDYIGAIVSGIILLVGAALLVTKTMKPLPKLEALQEFEATVAEVITVRPEWLRLADLFRERIERYDVRFIGRSAVCRSGPLGGCTTATAHAGRNEL